jgi:hypothetical protein
MDDLHIHRYTSSEYEMRLLSPQAEGGGAYLRASSLVRLLGQEAALDIPVTQAKERAGTLFLAGASPEFSVGATWRPQEGGCRWYTVDVQLTYTGEAPRDFGVQFCFDLVGAGKPMWMVPGAFYKQNRLAHCSRIYPRYDYEGGEAQELVSDWWAFRADRTALPAIFAWNEAMCAALCTDEVSVLGLAGVGFRGNAEGTSIWLNFPYREEPVVFDGEPVPQPPDCPLHNWQPGDSVALHFRVYVGPAALHAYDPFLREMYALHREQHALNPWMGLEEAATLTAHGLYHWHYHAEHGALYETAAFDREFNNNVKGQGDRPNMHVGWVSGAPYAHALLTYGREEGIEEYAEAGVAVLDKIASGLAPGGTFWGQWTLERGWGAGWNRNRHWIHARTVSEATLFMLRALRFEREHGFEHPEWAEAVRSNLNVALRNQREDGNFGGYYHAETGEVVEWEGAGGLLWTGALLEAADFWDEQEYYLPARRAGDYYSRFILDEFIYGAPEDVHLAPTSEDGYNAVVAYVRLYEADRDQRWLDLARRAADWTMTFRWTYNIAFPPRTLLAQYDFRSRGADQASPSNQHLHNYGLFCVPEMLRLWRYTGDDYYLERTRDNLACFLQFIAREDGDFNAYKGMVTERFYNTRCFQPKGMMLTLSHAWCVGVMLYAAQEALPYEADLRLPIVSRPVEASNGQYKTETGLSKGQC